MQDKKKIIQFGILLIIIGVLVIGGMVVYMENQSDKNRDFKTGLICEGNSVMHLYNSGKTELYRNCESNHECQENTDGSVSCVTEGNGGNGGDDDETKNCPPGTYLGDNDICFDYPGKDLPQGLDYEQCIETAVTNYYSQFSTKTHTISWITGKTMELDQYDVSDSWWKYIGCVSVRECWSDSGNCVFTKWGVTADCKTGRSGDMLTDSQTSNHNVCGSERLRG